MNFPGGRLLHTWELESQRVTLDDLLKSCGQVGLTGFAELRLSTGIGMIIYYLGAEVSAVFREGGAIPLSATYPLAGIYKPQKGVLNDLSVQGRSRYKGVLMSSAEGNIGTQIT